MNNNNFMPKPDSSIWNELSWHPSNDQMYQFQLFQDFLININSQLNLTRLLEGNDFWIAQVFDSLWPFKEELKTIDDSERQEYLEKENKKISVFMDLYVLLFIKAIPEEGRKHVTYRSWPEARALIKELRGFIDNGQSKR